MRTSQPFEELPRLVRSHSLRRNTEATAPRHRTPPLCLAVTILIIGTFIAWGDRYQPNSRPTR